MQRRSPEASVLCLRILTFLQMKNKAERPRCFLCGSRAVFEMFFNASVEDFSYFLGSVGAFGDHFWGNFGVIFGPWGALVRQRAPRSNSVPKQILWRNILGTLLETKILKNPTRAVPGRIFSVFLAHGVLHRFFYDFLLLSRPPRTSKV